MLQATKKLDLPAIVFLLLAMVAVMAAAQDNAPAQNGNAGAISDPGDVFLDWHTIEKNLYANAKPYVGLSASELENALPELQGVEFAQTQGQLSAILDQVGSQARNLLRNMPNLIAHEKLITQIQPNGRLAEQNYEYLILLHSKDKAVQLEEFRTNEKKNKNQAVDDPMTKGFASAWGFFYPPNQPESKFRYLGQQKVAGREILVVAFAQIPEQVRFPAEVEFGGKLVGVLEQGIAWIDPADFHIVRIRTDLLAPRSDIYLQKLSADVHFAQLSLPQISSSLWVPDDAQVTWNFKGQSVEQRHTYSKYHVYTVKTKILP